MILENWRRNKIQRIKENKLLLFSQICQESLIFKLKLQIPETTKLLGNRKKLINKTKNGKNMLSLQVVEVVLVQCNLVDYQYIYKKMRFCRHLCLISLMLICETLN